MRLLLADGRRSPSDAAAAEGFWMSEFSHLRDGELLKALREWMRQKPRGRPSVGELWAIIRPEGHQTQQDARRDDREVDKRLELSWAISVLSESYRYEKPEYRHTLDYAGRSLEAHGFTTWQEAKSYLCPGWTPSSVNEAYI